MLFVRWVLARSTPGGNQSLAIGGSEKSIFTTEISDETGDPFRIAIFVSDLAASRP
jgi:hypothetical protein